MISIIRKRDPEPESTLTNSGIGNALSPKSEASVASTQGEAKKGLEDK